MQREKPTSWLSLAFMVSSTPGAAIRGHGLCRSDVLDQPLAIPVCRLCPGNREMRQIAVHAHVRARALHEEFLACGGDLAESRHLLLPHREVVAFGDDHQRGCIENAGQERPRVIVPEKFDRLDGAVVLVAGRGRLLDFHEDGLGFRVRPGDHLFLRIARMRNEPVLAGQITALALLVDQRGQFTEPNRAVRTHGVVPTLDDRNLRNDALHPRVDRADNQRMPARIRYAPYGDARRIDDALERAKVADRVDGRTVIVYLVPRIKMLARLAIACAQAPVVEDQCRHAGAHEEFGVFRHDQFLDVTPAAAHDHDRKRAFALLWRVQVGADDLPWNYAWKFYGAAVHSGLLHAYPPLNA